MNIQQKTVHGNPYQCAFYCNFLFDFTALFSKGINYEV